MCDAGTYKGKQNRTDYLFPSEQSTLSTHTYLYTINIRHTNNDGVKKLKIDGSV